MMQAFSFCKRSAKQAVHTLARAAGSLTDPKLWKLDPLIFLSMFWRYYIVVLTFDELES